MPAVAEASFNKQAASAQSASSGMLHPPTNLSAVRNSNCSVTLSWTPTVDGQASGYTILNGGTVLLSVTPKTATSQKLTLSKNSSYSLTMVTVYLNWTSAASPAVAGSC
ncbi:hypothetical protein [Jatrophihabitans sp.]|uniref:hypothetical protein n=1 Tax=Jatrophihabitans sp. TaxID=1932789 RepID=UPI002BA45240|nr:hypothetical protein [Jatrophihabitans sp.]